MYLVVVVMMMSSKNIFPQRHLFLRFGLVRGGWVSKAGWFNAGGQGFCLLLIAEGMHSAEEGTLVAVCGGVFFFIFCRRIVRSGVFDATCSAACCRGMEIICSCGCGFFGLCREGSEGLR